MIYSGESFETLCYYDSVKIIALSSSRGTTFQAILDAIARGELRAQCVGLVTDRDDRGCVARARAAGIPVRVVERNRLEKREEYDRRLESAFEELRGDTPKTDLIIAAVGWMWVLSPWLVHRWIRRIVNVHPSLLPKYPGAHAHREVLAAKDAESGMTIHYIDEGVDTGPILLQKTCPVLPTDTEETLKSRVQALEQEWYPNVLAMLERGEL